MLSLVFSGRAGQLEVCVDDAERVEVVGGALAAGGRVLARFEKGVWLVGDEPIERIACHGLALLEARMSSGRSVEIGPFEQLAVAGDALVSGPGAIARYRALEETWTFVSLRDEGAAFAVKPLSSAATRAAVATGQTVLATA